MKFELSYSKEEIEHPSLFVQHITFACTNTLLTAICKTFWCSDHFPPSATALPQLQLWIFQGSRSELRLELFTLPCQSWYSDQEGFSGNQQTQARNRSM